eukprot:scaffold134348_cov81-Phaeocystis_antarctica.AAC.1
MRCGAGHRPGSTARGGGTHMAAGRPGVGPRSGLTRSSRGRVRHTLRVPGGSRPPPAPGLPRCPHQGRASPLDCNVCHTSITST